MPPSHTSCYWPSLLVCSLLNWATGSVAPSVTVDGSPQESHSHHDDHEGIEDPIKWVWLALGGVAVVALC